MNAIEARSLSKSFGSVEAVRSLELTVREGELFSLLGVNGAGKTTAVKLLCCLTAPTGGDALVMGHSVVREKSAVKPLINLSPQENAVARALSVRENLELVLGIYGLRKDEARARADRALDDYGLREVCEKRASHLSGGWQRRLGIASALITQPRVLFLDEPTLGLDVLARRELWGLIEGLKGRTTVVLTTHYLEEAEALSDRIGIMSRGSLIECGTPDEIKAHSGCGNIEDAFVAICERGEG